jgi:hypothetical protein
MRRMVRGVVRVSICAMVFSLAAPTATPQSGSPWNVELPGFLALAEDDLLVLLAPLDFGGCVDAAPLLTLEMPGLELWAPILVFDPGAPALRLHWVTTPNLADNISWHQDLHARVFRGDVNDLIADFLSDPCDFYMFGPLLAEGAVRFNYHSSDDALVGPGVNSWGWSMKSRLENEGACSPDRTPRLEWVLKWVVKSDDNLSAARVTASKGPYLNCVR